MGFSVSSNQYALYLSCLLVSYFYKSYVVQGKLGVFGRVKPAQTPPIPRQLRKSYFIY